MYSLKRERVGVEKRVSTALAELVAADKLVGVAETEVVDAEAQVETARKDADDAVVWARQQRDTHARQTELERAEKQQGARPRN